MTPEPSEERSRSRGAPKERAAAEEALEEGIALEGRAHVTRDGGIDVDHRRRDPLHDRREGQADRLAALRDTASARRAPPGACDEAAICARAGREAALGRRLRDAGAIIGRTDRKSGQTGDGGKLPRSRLQAQSHARSPRDSRPEDREISARGRRQQGGESRARRATKKGPRAAPRSFPSRHASAQAACSASASAASRRARSPAPLASASRSTNSITATGALSPWRKPAFSTRV